MSLQLTGKRYVYFNSINSKKGLSTIAASAQRELNEVKQTLSYMNNQYQSETQEQLFSIKNYIDFVDTMAATEATAAEDFFKQQIELLKKHEEFDLAQDLEQYLTGSTQDPMQFIFGLNKLFQGAQAFEDNVKQGLVRIKSISDNMDKLDKETQDRLTVLFEEDYDQYIKELNEAFKTIDTNNVSTAYKDIKNMNTLLANTVNKVIKDLSTNGNFIDQLQSQFQNSLKISQNDFKSIVINTIVDQVVNLQATSFSQELSSNIQDALVTVVKKIADGAEIDRDYTKVLNNTTKELKSIEETAFKDNESLANIILRLDDKSIKDVKKRYKKTATLIDNLIELKNKPLVDEKEMLAAKKKLTEELRKAVKRRAKHHFRNMVNEINSSNAKEKLGQIDKFITPLSLSTTLSAQLSDMSISHDALAEAIVSTESLDQIKGAILSNTPGKKINLKADVEYSIGVVSSGTTFIDESAVQSMLNSTIKEYFTSFMKNYKSEGHGATDINAAIKAYNQRLSNMKNKLDQLVEDNNLPDESKKELYEELYKTFSVSVSVKDYDLYNNQFGVHGGNLGAGQLAENVINNIDKLYELGGITTIDKEKVLFAALNCGQDSIGAGMQQHLQTYLLGGAALMMFDDCFANTKQFLETTKKNFDNFKGQQTVHFYRVQNLYMPASFMLQEISTNLKQMYADLEQGVSFDNIIQNNRVHISNPITEKDIPKGGTLQERFNAVSEKAQQNTKITFSFMGGLLDIFDNFSKAFEQQ